jgi:hypothetical protein
VKKYVINFILFDNFASKLVWIDSILDLKRPIFEFKLGCKFYKQNRTYTGYCRLGGAMVNVLAIGPEVRGFIQGEAKDFKGR